METTVGELVVKDFRTAAVFERYSIDFCCHGNVGLEEACRQRGVSVEQVRSDISVLGDSKEGTAESFDSWELDRLADYIIDTHHAFVRSSIPVLLGHTQKVASVHGGRHPELVDIRDTFAKVAEEMTRHMQKEEMMLFPYIKRLATATRTEAFVAIPPFQSIQKPVRMMESEHLSAGDGVERIRNQSLTYLVPADACATYRVTYQELDAFERDLHKHVHLENNILFPKAIELEQRVFAMSHS